MTALPARLRAFVAEKVDDRVERAVRDLGPEDLPPDGVTIRSPDSIRFGREIGWFRAHDGRGIAKIGHLTLDQETARSNTPSVPRRPGAVI